MSTVENQQYGGDWHTCHHCGVKDRRDQLTFTASTQIYVHTEAKAAKCAEWKATLGRATPQDLLIASFNLKASGK